MKIAIDLLWLRPGKVGGTEFYIRNLLDGFLELEDIFEFVLLLSRDNAKSFEEYLKDKRISAITADVDSANISKRIIWQNLNQNRLLRKYKLKYCFTPVYCRPFLNGGIVYINTIHDIQAYHYPQYHPVHEILYSKLCWHIDRRFSKKIIGISEYVKQDLIKTYKFKPEKVETIYNSILVNPEEIIDIKVLEEKFNISRFDYYYTVAQLIPHKNLETLIRVMAKIKKEDIDLPNKLLVSGISGNATKQVKELIENLNLEDNVILTGFVQNDERNTLYRYCKCFLFPSVFEGFGMPLVEAMGFGATVITTRCTSIPEVTQEKANYVENPYSVNDWITIMQNPINRNDEMDLSLYDKKVLAQKYLKVLTENFDG